MDSHLSQSNKKKEMKPQNPGNPALRMMGIPQIRARLPSRNWLIFWSVLGSFSAAVAYDRYQKRKIQQKWCNAVAHIADEPLPTHRLPRRVTIFLQAPPGDYIVSAREHFQEYIKPILVAAAVDWDIIEGRKEDDIRYKVAERIRTTRGEAHPQPWSATLESTSSGPPRSAKEGIDAQEPLERGGDLVLGRHTWKEYVRGCHEGWLGTLAPQNEKEVSQAGLHVASAVNPFKGQSMGQEALVDNSLLQNQSSNELEANQADPSSDKQVPSDNPDPNSAAKNSKAPHILPIDYANGTLPATVALAFEPSVAVPFPHLLGFMSTPVRVWRFLNKRSVAEEIGAIVSAFLVAPQDAVRPFKQSLGSAVNQTEFSSFGMSPDRKSHHDHRNSGEVQNLLLREEKDWHKSATSPNADGEVRPRPWQEEIITDERVEARMRTIDKFDAENTWSSSRISDSTLDGLHSNRGLSSANKPQRNPKGIDWKGSADRREVVTWNSWIDVLPIFRRQREAHPWEQGGQDESGR